MEGGNVTAGRLGGSGALFPNLGKRSTGPSGGGVKPGGATGGGRDGVEIEARPTDDGAPNVKHRAGGLPVSEELAAQTSAA